MKSSPTLGNSIRETGLALAILAIWMLSLLAPLHQSSGLLRVMADAGHQVPAGWSICITLDADGGDKDHAIPVCPAQGIGKSGLTAPPPPVMLAVLLQLPQAAAFSPATPRLHRAQNSPPGQPRAPPAQV
ncbi:hypothetical protein [Szabonella alba]|uniref:Uncharacterized protein n=1 Tax=Szabonella alba TaxID=2804194 RepID=A0A8K0VAT6_9RHOB|nr:hypothetical protein [Szabonella alba]MBL4916379.1 hypothetical protein [Szabonella alba]